MDQYSRFMPGVAALYVSEIPKSFHEYAVLLPV